MARVVHSPKAVGRMVGKAPRSDVTSNGSALHHNLEASSEVVTIEAGVEHEPSGIPGVRAPTKPFLAPDAGVRVVAPPTLSWEPVENVRLYRVLLFRDASVVLDEGTLRSSLTLTRLWTYAHKQQELRRGAYRWEVTAISESREGKKRLVKASSFVFSPL